MRRKGEGGRRTASRWRLFLRAVETIVLDSSTTDSHGVKSISESVESRQQLLTFVDTAKNREKRRIKKGMKDEEAEGRYVGLHQCQLVTSERGIRFSIIGDERETRERERKRTLLDVSLLLNTLKHPLRHQKSVPGTAGTVQ
jgi:hypothetical protein